MSIDHHHHTKHGGNGGIKYDPVKADFDFKLVLKPIVFTSGIKFTVTGKGEKSDVILDTNYTFEITKTDYTIYP